jgi:hexosaminidase
MIIAGEFHHAIKKQIYKQMNRSFTRTLFLLCLVSIYSCKPNRTFTENEIALIPQVRNMTLGVSSFQFNENTKFVVENIDQQVIASQFAELFNSAAGWKLQVNVGDDEGSNQVYFKTEPIMAPEAYSLEITTKRIEIRAAKPAGFFYAIQTLRQLLPPEIESSQIDEYFDWLVPVVNISDSPAFKWRGFMLDVSRHFFPKEDVLRMIDNLALHKINTLHLHLVDDQGWRIEIKKYPKLTQVGAWRVDRENQPWSSRARQAPEEKATYGGFYTQNDIKEMVEYAQKRFINIVPEIEMPAHVTSALAAYPQFSCTGGPFTVPPGGVWPITDIYCPGKDSTFYFLEDVLTEVMDLFPSKYIHIGGDEATKTEWEKCPDCKKRIRTEGLKDVDDLQNYLVRRIENFIRSKNRILIGWDEILDGNLPQEATVMSWRGVKRGIEAAKLGHDVVMSPTSECYFDYYQGLINQEPLAIGGFTPLQKVYAFNPVPDELNSEEAKHILGGQANLWTEFVPNIQHAEYMAFPRIAALAEVLWSPGERRSWEDFALRIQIFMKRYDRIGLIYARSVYQATVEADLDAGNKHLMVTLSCEFPGSEIHYTIDGSVPTNLSEVYAKPIIINQSTILKAITFSNGIPVGKQVEQSFNISKATVKPVKYQILYSDYYKGSGDFSLVDGIRGTTNHKDGAWQAWIGANMDVNIDLTQKSDIHGISIGSLQNSGSWIFFPRKVEFFVSTDGTQFKKVGEVVNDIDPFSREIQLKDFSVSFNPQTVRYVKIVALNLGKVPVGHAGEGNKAWLFVDEIAIE